MRLRLGLLVLALLLCPYACWAGEPLGRVVIDPGHGGYDPGAIRNGVAEKVITLQISQEVKKILSENNVEVLLTREGDYNLAIPGLHKKDAKRYDFERRIELSEKARADAMVSIHVNIGRQKCSGPEAFYFIKSTQGKALADCIQKELHQIPEIHHRTVKTGRYYLLKNTKMPCVLVETGFLNNKAEREKLTDKIHQQALAAAIARGILNYLEVKDKLLP